MQVPLQQPVGGITPDGVNYTYTANDASVGDIDGDGQYEIILKWNPTNAKDNSHSGYTGNVYLDAYEMDGTFLWRIDLGRNIRAGAHYTQFMVYDFDSDGRAEIACKTADGTIDGLGTVIGDGAADFRQSNGYILSGPEYFTVFDGSTGGILATTNYNPPRHPSTLFPTSTQLNDVWGDGYGNRVDRFLAGVAYLDGERPSIIMCRGYYTRTVLVAWDYRDGQLTQRWVFDSDVGYPTYAGQGCHSLSIADVDFDGKDEIIYGSCTIDDDGTGLYSTQLGHGDALHVTDMDPDRPGLEVWECHEQAPYGATFRDAATGEVLFNYTAGKDTGRACAADITAGYRGVEVWASTGVPLTTATGTNLGSHSLPVNFVVWWDGDDLRELLNSNTITKYGAATLLTATGCISNNGTKSTPALQADLFGDWREEVIFRTSDNQALRIYTTTDVTSRRIYSLMHDSQYRVAIAWQNTAYNQPPHSSFYLGDGMNTPPIPDIELVQYNDGSAGLLNEWWTDVPGNKSDDLINHSDYPDVPSGSRIISEFQGVLNWNDNYGSRVRGFIVPPTDGDYTFWLAADDWAQLSIGSSALDNQTQIIASVLGWSYPFEWDKYPSQQSPAVTLKAGHKYYVELIHKEATGDDHFAVAWQGPGFSQQVIANEYLIPWPWHKKTQGELTGNNIVNREDFTIFTDHWLETDCLLPLTLDFNGDCTINMVDYGVFTRNWLTSEIITKQIQENETGFVAIVNGTIDSNNTGFTGSGFANTNNAAGQYIEWSVEALAAGVVYLHWRMANGYAANRNASVTVNGVTQVANVDFVTTGSWTSWGLSQAVSVTLVQGVNTIKLVAQTANGLANIDYIELTGYLMD